MHPGFTAPQPAASAGPGQLVGVIDWQRIYFDEHGKSHRTSIKVPVNQSGQMAGKPFACPKCKDTTWFPAGTKLAPVCTKHPTRKMLPVQLKPPTIGQRIGDLGASVSWLHPLWKATERPLRPVWALVLGSGVAVLVDAADVPALLLAPLVPVAEYAVARVARWRLTGRAERAGRLDFEDPDGNKRIRAAIARTARTVGYAAAGTFAALTAVAALGVDVHGVPGWLALTAVAAAWLFPAATWWRSNRTAPKPVAPEPPPVEAPRLPSDDELSAADAVRTWRDEVALTGTDLDPGSWRRIKGGWQAVIVASKRGALNVLGGDNMTGTVKRIAAGFDVPRAAIGWIDEYEGSPNRALLLVQPNSPLNDDVAWQPPGILDVGNAFLHMGMKITGDPLRTRLWTPGWGAPSRYIAGTKGSGKTEALRLLILGMLEAQVAAPLGPRRLVAPFLHDPKRGKDFGAFRRQVSGFSTDPEMLHLIVEAFIREMDRRYDSLGSDIWFDEFGRPREGETAFDPSVHGPILSLIVDEFHEPAKDQLLMGKLEPMARKMRAAGIEFVAATHMSTIGDSGSQVFRDMLAGGEAWLFRTTSALNAALATGGQLIGDPRSLPRAPGSVLVASGDDATMQARVAYVPSEPLYNRLYDEQNRSRIMPVEWPPETLEAFGPEFVQWMRECQARQPGDAAPALPRRTDGPAAAVQAPSARTDTRCVDAVLSALAGSPVPLDMNALESHPLISGGGWSLRTIRDSLKKLRESGLAFTSGTGSATRHELTPQARADIEAQLQAKFEEVQGDEVA